MRRSTTGRVVFELEKQVCVTQKGQYITKGSNVKQIESILLERVEIGGRLKSVNPVSFRQNLL